MLEQFIEALREGKEYDYIASEYYKMSREDLKSIILEYMYNIHINTTKFDSEERKEELLEAMESLL